MEILGKVGQPWKEKHSIASPNVKAELKDGLNPEGEGNNWNRKRP